MLLRAGQSEVPLGAPTPAARRHLLEALACGGVGSLGARAASANADVATDSGGPQTRMLDDAEVSEVRRVQRELQMYDMKRRRFVALTELLRPGELLYDADAVCIGELHDSKADHTVQRVIIDALTYNLFLELRKNQGVNPAADRGSLPQNASPKRLAVGVEYFNRQQQGVLDMFSAGGKSDMTLTNFRKETDWDNVWSYDWEQYAPLFRFCQLNATRMIGLNVPFEVSLEVSKKGLKSLPDWLQPLLPEVDLSQMRHRRRFEDMMRMSVEDAASRMSEPLGSYSPRPGLDKMYESQTLWDEYMADTARRYLSARGGRLVILAGVNHVWRDAIPDRVEAQSARSGGTPLRAASVAPWRGRPEDAAQLTCADYLWMDAGPGGGQEAAAAMQEQRQRLLGKSRVFPAGYI